MVTLSDGGAVLTAPVHDKLSCEASLRAEGLRKPLGAVLLTYCVCANLRSRRLSQPLWSLKMRARKEIGRSLRSALLIGKGLELRIDQVVRKLAVELFLFVINARLLAQLVSFFGGDQFVCLGSFHRHQLIVNDGISRRIFSNGPNGQRLAAVVLKASRRLGWLEWRRTFVWRRKCDLSIQELDYVLVNLRVHYDFAIVLRLVRRGSRAIVPQRSRRTPSGNARGIWVSVLAALVVQLKILDSAVSKRFLFAEGWVRNLSRDYAVDFTNAARLVLIGQSDQQVKVGEATLLKLHYANMCNSGAKDAFLDHLNQAARFVVKHPTHNVRAIAGSLPWQKGFGDLLPLGVSGEGDEKVGLAKATDYTHGLIKLLG